jgi:hypothetical protein
MQVKRYLRGLERVVCREMDVHEEDTTAVWGVILKKRYNRHVRMWVGPVRGQKRGVWRERGQTNEDLGDSRSRISNVRVP